MAGDESRLSIADSAAVITNDCFTHVVSAVGA